MFKLIAIDLDDTLFEAEAELPQVNARALRALDRAGVHVVLASGRPTPAAARTTRSVLGTDQIHYVISFNGAVISDAESGREIKHHGVPSAAAAELFRYAREHGLLAQYYHDDEFFVEFADPRADDYSELSGLPYRVVGPLEKFMDTESPKILMQGPPEELPRHLERLRGRAKGRWHATMSKPHFLELLNPRINKGLSLVELADYLGVARRDTVAVGDSLNDIEMLKEAGVGAAVANARNEVKAVADLVTERTAGEGGVAEAVMKLFGIEV
jgi:Cof subfamily protein (haloacid dehalogenase superfamily)